MLILLSVLILSLLSILLAKETIELSVSALSVRVEMT